MTGPASWPGWPTALGAVLAALALLALPRPVAATRVARLRPAAGRRPPGRSWPTWSVAVGVTLAGALVAGPGGAVVGLLGALLGTRSRARSRAQRRAAEAAEELAAAVRRVADELRAGAHPAAALRGVAADGPRARAILAPAAAAAALGEGVPAALRRAADEHPEVAADLGRIASAWAVAETHGAPLADLLASVHADLEWRGRFAAGVRAGLAGPRATATVLTALPLVGLGLGQLSGADPVGVLRGGLTGQVLLVSGAILTAAGVLWTEHIVTTAVPR